MAKPDPHYVAVLNAIVAHLQAANSQTFQIRPQASQFGNETFPQPFYVDIAASRSRNASRVRISYVYEIANGADPASITEARVMLDYVTDHSDMGGGGL